MTKDNVNISVTVTRNLKKALDNLVEDTHISYGDFFREAARQHLMREYPEYAESFNFRGGKE